MRAKDPPMDDGEREETLSISLVDGITCGLASALLLLIIFGINIAASTASLGGKAGRGTTTTVPSGLMSEPIDMIVEILGPTNAVATGSGWQHPDPKDHMIRNEDRTVFIRELPDGFVMDRITGTEAPPAKVAFGLNWQVSNPPKVIVHIFRSGSDAEFNLKCKQAKQHFDLIKGFDLMREELKGDCTPE